MVYLVPTLLRGNAYLSRSHAPAWECIQWSISFPRSCVGMHTCADRISNRPGYLVPTLLRGNAYNGLSRSHAREYLVPTLLRGNAYNGLSRSHAPAWECIPALSRSHAPAWECIPTLTVYLVPTREHISRSHAPAWECIPTLTVARTAPAISFPRESISLVPTLQRGNAYLR